MGLSVAKNCLRHWSQPGLSSFYKSYSKKSGLNIWAPLPTEHYKNKSGHSTDLCFISKRLIHVTEKFNQIYQVIF